MHAQQDETKKLMDFELGSSYNFEFYLNEIIAGITDNKFDMDMHSTYKFLFYHFSNLRRNLGKETYKIRHNIVSECIRMYYVCFIILFQHALEFLQSKDWTYFINHLLEASKGDITSINLGRIISQNENDVEELKIMNDTIDNLQICKNVNTDIYVNVDGSFQNYLKNAPDVLI